MAARTAAQSELDASFLVDRDGAGTGGERLLLRA
jgi:hypothetical protein